MDFPKTIYVQEDGGSDGGLGIGFNYFDDIDDCEDKVTAVYTLKEVKKKVTNVTLEEIENKT